MKDRNFLPVPPPPEPGWPTDWVGLHYEGGGCVGAEKAMGIPTLRGKSLWIHLYQIDTTVDHMRGVSDARCRFIVDTHFGDKGPVLLIGERKNGEEVVTRRVGDKEILVELPDELAPICKGGKSPDYKSTKHDAFASLIATALFSRGAHGYAAPLHKMDKEDIREFEEQAINLCLMYLAADVVIPEEN